MIRNKALILLVLLMTLGGCAAPTKEPESSGKPSGATGSSNASSGNTAGDPAETKPADLATIPAELRHEAFRWYGLGGEKPLKMKLTATNRSGPEVGEQRFEFEGMKDGAAQFKVVRTDGLAVLGSEDLSVTKEGVVAVSSSLGKLSDPSLEMPSDFSPGKSWNTSSSFENPQGGKFVATSKYQAVKREKVKTEAGEFDAILVTSSGTIKADNQIIRMSAKAWFVENMGPVKTIIETSQPGQATQTMTVELTK